MTFGIYEDGIWGHEYADNTTQKQIKDFWNWFNQNHLSAVITGSCTSSVNDQIRQTNEVIIADGWNKIFK